jgi:Type IV secretion-system coupling protein DNA-binding domain
MTRWHIRRPCAVSIARYAESMQRNPDISYFGRTNTRHPHQTFGIWQADRMYHLYVIGQTGTGKSSMLETLALQDIHGGRGVCVIDPHGDLVERLVANIPASRQQDLIYLNVPDPSQPYGYNPLRKVRHDRIPLAASGLLEAMKKLWVHEWGVRMEHILRNSLYALIEYGEATLPDVLRILTDKDFRRVVLLRVTNHQVREFWEHEFPKYNPRYRQEAISPIQNKIGAFLADPRLHRILTNPTEDIRIRHAMDKGKILLVNLARGDLGEDSAGLLGALLVTTISLAAFSRSDTPEDARVPFYLYLDEFQSFTTESVASMVSELRKYKVALTLAHQHLEQLEPAVRHAVLGNAGTVITFRLGAEDAALFSKEFAHVFSPDDFVTLPNYHTYIRLMIGGSPCNAFSATTVRPSSLDYTMIFPA